MKSPTARDAAHPEDSAAEGGGAPAPPPSLRALDPELFQDVTVRLKASLGDVSLSVKDLLELKAGSVVQLDQKLNDYVEIRLNDTLIAYGEIVAVGDRFGVRLIDIVPTP